MHSILLIGGIVFGLMLLESATVVYGQNFGFANQFPRQFNQAPQWRSSGWPTPAPQYGYNYGVNDPYTGDNKKVWETRDGDVVRGGYIVDDADGTTRVVEYTADSVNGFNAVVKRLGNAVHTANGNEQNAIFRPRLIVQPAFVAGSSSGGRGGGGFVPSNFYTQF